MYEVLSHDIVVGIFQVMPGHMKSSGFIQEPMLPFLTGDVSGTFRPPFCAKCHAFPQWQSSSINSCTKPICIAMFKRKICLQADKNMVRSYQFFRDAHLIVSHQVADKTTTVGRFENPFKKNTSKHPMWVCLESKTLQEESYFPSSWLYPLTIPPSYPPYTNIPQISNIGNLTLAYLK